MKKNFRNFRSLNRTVYSNGERSEQFLVTESFFNLFLEVSHLINNPKKFDLEIDDLGAKPCIPYKSLLQ